MQSPPQPVSCCKCESPFCTAWLRPQAFPIFFSNLKVDSSSCSHFRVASPSFSFARHGCCHRSLQLSPRMFESYFVILVIKINKVNSSSSIVEFWLLVFPFLSLSILTSCPNFGPYFRPHMIWSRCRLNFCQSPPGPHISSGRFLFQQIDFCESFPRIRQTSVRTDIPVVINTFLLHDVQISTSRPCYIKCISLE